MCTRGKLFWLGRSVGISKSIFEQNFHLAPFYKYRPRPYAALCFKKVDSPVQNFMNTRAYAKDASKQSTSLINGLKGTATALVNQINDVLDIWGLLGQLMQQPRKPNSLELCLEEQQWAEELEKSKKVQESLRAEEDRKQKIWDDALLLSKGSKKDLEKCCKKLAADKKKKDAAKKKKKALEKCCKKLAADKKKKDAAKKKKKALEKCCKKMAADKKKKKKKKKDC